MFCNNDIFWFSFENKLGGLGCSRGRVDYNVLPLCEGGVFQH
jgi:hypothetical protein